MGHIDFDAARERVDLVDYIAQDLGRDPDVPSRTDPKWCCPFHQDNDPSMKVDVKEQVWYCYGCRTGGNIYHYVTKRLGMDLPTGHRVDYTNPNDPLLRAYGVITNETVQTQVRIARKKRPRWEKNAPGKRPTRPPTMQQVERYAQNQEPTFAFFNGERGLSKETICNYHLGTIPRWTIPKQYYWRSDTYQNDEPLSLPPNRRFTIPYVIVQWVRDIKRRRDDTLCLDILNNFGEDVIEKIRMDLAMARNIMPEDITMPKILDAVFGDKYMRIAGMQAQVFNLRRLLHHDEMGKPVRDAKGNLISRKRELIIVTEGEVDAMSAENLGYPAVSIGKKEIDLSPIFAEVLYTIILADNDQAGEINAKSIRSRIGKAEATILRVPDPFKDANQFMVQDPDGFNKFMAAAKAGPTL